MSQNNVIMNNNNVIRNTMTPEQRRIVTTFIEYINEIFLNPTKRVPNKETIRYQRISNFLNALLNVPLDNPTRDFIQECLFSIDIIPNTTSVLFRLGNHIVVHYPYLVETTLTQYATTCLFYAQSV